MLSYFIRRVLVAIPTLILVSIFVFTLQKLLPGDPVLVMAGEERDPEVLAYLREKYRLNEPVVVQYFYWLGGVLQGDLGISLRTNQPVTTLIAQKLPVTIQLAVMSMIMAFLVGIPAGIISAIRQGTWVDYIANVIALSGLSIPNFWLGIMLANDDHAGLCARYCVGRRLDASYTFRHAGRIAGRLCTHGARKRFV